jgi:hypothetical protein
MIGKGRELEMCNGGEGRGRDRRLDEGELRRAGFD